MIACIWTGVAHGLLFARCTSRLARVFHLDLRTYNILGGKIMKKLVKALEPDNPQHRIVTLGCKTMTFPVEWFPAILPFRGAVQRLVAAIYKKVDCT